MVPTDTTTKKLLLRWERRGLGDYKLLAADGRILGSLTRTILCGSNCLFWYPTVRTGPQPRELARDYDFHAARRRLRQAVEAELTTL